MTSTARWKSLFLLFLIKIKFLSPRINVSMMSRSGNGPRTRGSDLSVFGLFQWQFHLLRAATPRLPCQFRLRAQKLFRRILSFRFLGCGAGALRWEPVARLYLRLPLAVRPPPRFTGNFSPRFTLNETFPIVVRWRHEQGYQLPLGQTVRVYDCPEIATNDVMGLSYFVALNFILSFYF